MLTRMAVVGGRGMRTEPRRENIIESEDKSKRGRKIDGLERVPLRANTRQNLSCCIRIFGGNVKLLFCFNYTAERGKLESVYLHIYWSQHDLLIVSIYCGAL